MQSGGEGRRPRWLAHAVIAALGLSAGYGLWSLGHRQGVASAGSQEQVLATAADTQSARVGPGGDADGGLAGRDAAAAAADLSPPATPESAAVSDGADADAALPAPTTASADDSAAPSPPLAIEAEPPALRVWHNTALRLRVLPRPAEADAWQRFVWHFEDGSAPVAGEAVLHVFAESVTDRHITLEAFRRDGSRVVVSKRLPIERLAIVAVDGASAAAETLPPARAGRLLLIGEGPPLLLAPLLAAVAEAGVVAVVAVGAADWADAVAAAATSKLPKAAVLALDDAVDAPGGTGSEPQTPRPPLLRILRAAEGAVATLPDSQALVIADIAVVPFDSRPWTVGEPALAALRRDLRLAAAWPALIVLGPRPLAALVDGEAVADRAYRVYEHALRERAVAMVSTASGVAFDGRYGGLYVVGVGRMRPDGCARLAGSDRCQPGTASLIEVREGGVRAFHLSAPGFEGWLGADDLPASVGRYRRDVGPARRSP